MFLTKVLTNKTKHIQGDSGGICTTLGNDSMSDSKQNFIRTWIRFWTVTKLWPLESWNRR